MPVRLALLPRSNARNAFELLDDIVNAVQAEPLRLDMQTWLYEEGDVYHPFIPLRTPQCGTVACIAGWGTILTTDPTLPVEEWRERVSVPAMTMRRILTPDRWETARDDYDGLGREEKIEAKEYHQAVRDLFMEQIDWETPGTPEYVAIVVARIRAFQDRWGHILRAQALPRPDINPMPQPSSSAESES